MKVIDLIKQLQSKGFNVHFLKRSDGGYLITSINGVSFKGANGNEYARNLIGVELSSKQLEQRRAAQAKQYGGLTKEERRAYQSLKMVYTSKGAGNKITIQRFRELKATIGSERAIASARGQARYKKGYAYEKNVEWQIARLESIKNHYLTDKLDTIINYLKSNIGNIMDKDLMRAYQQTIYPLSQGRITIDEAERELKQIYHIA